MRQVAEIMYVVESEREAFLKGALCPDEETKDFLWLCGVRRQQYYALNEFILMTFEYEGNQFKEDMGKMAAFLAAKGHLITKRRRDVPVEEREKTNWWAPMKKLGTILEEKPEGIIEREDNVQESYMAMLDGAMRETDYQNDISYDEEEWMEDVRIW